MIDLFLSSGNKMPIIGLGTADPMHDKEKLPQWMKSKLFKTIYRRTVFKVFWVINGFKLTMALKHAINSGYKMIDTSSSYNNGFFIYLAIKLSKYNRKDIFIITRISNKEQLNGSVRKSVEKSLKNLRTDYIDLFMFHWPVPNKFLKTWKEMELLYNEGILKSLGVANCHEHHLNDIFEIATVRPSVNEFEIHPLFTQKRLIDFCVTNNIIPMAYTPLGRMHPKIMQNLNLIKIAKKYNKTSAQIVLRWHIQKGVSAIPRSVNISNISKNINIFDFTLSNKEMNQIDKINQDMRLRYDPDNCDFTKL